MTRAQLSDENALRFFEVLQHLEACQMYCEDVMNYKRSCITSLNKNQAEAFAELVSIETKGKRISQIRDEICVFIEKHPYFKASNFDLIESKVKLLINTYNTNQLPQLNTQSRSQIDYESQAQVQAIDYDDFTN